MQWKEAVNQSFFGTGDSDSASAPALSREHSSAPDQPAAAVHPPSTGATNVVLQNGPFMEDSLRAVRRGLLVQMQVQHSTQRSCSAGDLQSGSHEGGGGGGVGGGVAGAGNFSLMLDMGSEFEEAERRDGAEGGEDPSSTASAAVSGTSRPVMFIAHEPLVFACLRHSLNIPDNEYREAFFDDGFQALNPATSKSGRSFYMTKDDRFILKSLSRAEADFLLDVLCHYYEHVAKHPSTLLPRFCGLYEVSEKGRDVIICVEANAFSSQCPIDERYDLKGSVVGRMTREEDKAKDANVILKDLDLTRQLPLGLTCRSLLLMQLKSDCQFLENLEIVDYSLLLGVHNPHRSLAKQAEEAAAAAGHANTPADAPPRPPAPDDAAGAAAAAGRRSESAAGDGKTEEGGGGGGERRERRDSFEAGKKAHWSTGGADDGTARVFLLVCSLNPEP